MTFSPGTPLGAYEITGHIGDGGMGHVFRASDTRLKRQVAIKVLPPALAADVQRIARFRREAEVLASLNHPHIAAVYGLEESAPSSDATAGMAAQVMECTNRRSAGSLSRSSSSSTPASTGRVPWSA